MAEFESQGQTPESRIVLVDKTGNAIEVSPTAQVGAERYLRGVRSILEAGIEGGLLLTNPFIPKHKTELAEPAPTAVSTSAPKRIEPPKYYPEIPLPDELERQRVELAERIAVPLGIDRGKFFAKLPTRFPEREPDYDRLHLNVPLIDPNLSLFGLTWLQAVEGTLFYNPNDPEHPLKAYIWGNLKNRIDRLKEWKDPRRGIEPFPQVPHAVWIQDGTRYVSKKPGNIREKLEKPERAGNHWKGLGLSALRPDMIQTMFWDLIGGQVEADGVLYVDWHARPGFYYAGDGVASSQFRILVSGSKFTVA